MAGSPDPHTWHYRVPTQLVTRSTEGLRNRTSGERGGYWKGPALELERQVQVQPHPWKEATVPARSSINLGWKTYFSGRCRSHTHKYASICVRILQRGTRNVLLNKCLWRVDRASMNRSMVGHSLHPHEAQSSLPLPWRRL